MVRIIVLKKKSLLWIVAALLCAIAVIAAVALYSRGDRKNVYPSAAMRTRIEEYELNVLAGKKRELPVYSVDRTDKKIALTIDAAWEDDKTEFILEKEITTLDDTIEQLTGKRCKLFRAPFGEYNDTVITAVREIGYEPIQWNIDTIDWKEERSADTILNTVLPKLSDGCIILCHNNGYKIREYLPRLLETALQQGYTFVTVSELLLEGDTTIDANGVQKMM